MGIDETEASDALVSPFAACINGNTSPRRQTPLTSVEGSVQSMVIVKGLGILVLLLFGAFVVFPMVMVASAGPNAWNAQPTKYRGTGIGQ